MIHHSMDRLVRNLDDVRKVALGLKDRGIHVRLEKEDLTFTGEDSPKSDPLLSVMGALAQFERDMIRERQLDENRLHQAERRPLTSGESCA